MFNKKLLANKQVYVTFGILLVTFFALLGVKLATNAAMEYTQQPEKELIAEMFVSTGLQECLSAAKPEAIRINEGLIEARRDAVNAGNAVGVLGLLAVLLLLYVSSVVITVVQRGK